MRKNAKKAVRKLKENAVEHENIIETKIAPLVKVPHEASSFTDTSSSHDITTNSYKSPEPFLTLMSSKMKTNHKFECIMHMAPSIVGWVIGKGGQRIRDLMFDSGAKIWIDQDSMGPKEARIVYVSGGKPNVDDAVRMIKELVAKAPVGGGGTMDNGISKDFKQNSHLQLRNEPGKRGDFTRCEVNKNHVTKVLDNFTVIQAQPKLADEMQRKYYRTKTVSYPKTNFDSSSRLPETEKSFIATKELEHRSSPYGSLHSAHKDNRMTQTKRKEMNENSLNKSFDNVSIELENASQRKLFCDEPPATPSPQTAYQVLSSGSLNLSSDYNARSTDALNANLSSPHSDYRRYPYKNSTFHSHTTGTTHNQEGFDESLNVLPLSIDHTKNAVKNSAEPEHEEFKFNHAQNQHNDFHQTSGLFKSDFERQPAISSYIHNSYHNVCNDSISMSYNNNGLGTEASTLDSSLPVTDRSSRNSNSQPYLEKTFKSGGSALLGSSSFSKDPSYSSSKLFPEGLSSSAHKIHPQRSNTDDSAIIDMFASSSLRSTHNGLNGTSGSDDIFGGWRNLVGTSQNREHGNILFDNTTSSDIWGSNSSNLPRRTQSRFSDNSDWSFAPTSR